MSSLPTVRPIRTVLAATDLSEASKPALHAAGRLAAALGAELHVVHALADALDPRLDFLTEEFAAKVLKEAQDELQAMSSAMGDGTAALVSVEVRRGVAVDVVLEDIKRIKADLLVLGTHGRTGLERLALGSVAEHLASVVPIDVLLVPAEADGPYRRPLIAARDDEFSMRAAARAIAVAGKLGFEAIDLVSAFELPYGWHYVAGDDASHLERMRAIRSDGLALAIKALKAAGLSGEQVLEEGTASKVVKQTIDRLGSDLVFVGSHNRPAWTAMLLGDTARNIAHSLDRASLWLVRSLPEKHPLLDHLLRDLGLR
ncbi:MAG TPA: universal stress protein [Planctomycetota bacterium]